MRRMHSMLMSAASGCSCKVSKFLLDSQRFAILKTEKGIVITAVILRFYDQHLALQSYVNCMHACWVSQCAKNLVQMHQQQSSK